MCGVLVLAHGCGRDVGRPPGPAVIESYPAAEQLDVPRLLHATISFDARLDPLSVSRATVWLSSGPVRVVSAVSFDPIDRAATLAPFFGTALEPEVSYRLTVEGVRDLSGNLLAERYVAPFRTGLELGEPPARPVVEWAEIEPFFLERCAGAACHGTDRPASGLDLSSGRAVRQTAIGVSSRLPGAGALSELAEFPIIDVTGGLGRPSHSYMLYKVLGDPNITGDPMPPDQLTDPTKRATPEEVRRLSDWIASGAPTD